jgi:hypothetical protein
MSLRSKTAKRNVRPRRKTPTRQQLDKFWEEKNIRTSTRRKPENPKGQRQWFDQWGVRVREPAWVTPTLVGTIRTFTTQTRVREFLEYVTIINRFIGKKKSKSYEILKMQVIDANIEKHRILERAYMGPNVQEVTTCASYEKLAKQSLYGKILARKMIQKNVPYEELREWVLAAYRSLHDDILPIYYKLLKFDFQEQNVLVVDYNPATNKPLFAIVDHGRSESTVDYSRMFY